MPREVKTPVLLWICAAVCAHYVFGQGGMLVGEIHDGKSAMWVLMASARERTAAQERTFEVAISDAIDDTKKASDEELQNKPDDQKTDEEKKDEEKKKEDEKKVEPPKPEKQKPEPPKPEDPKKKLEQEKKKAVIKLEEKKAEEQKKLEEELKRDKRIAVKQHAQPNQQDNPKANFIADQANRVKEETQATQTAHDRDDEKPTPGGNHPGRDPNPGDSDKTAIRDSEEQKGEKNRAPGEKGTDFDVQRIPTPPMKAAPAPTVVQGPPAPKPPAAAGDNKPQAPSPTPAKQAPEPPKVAAVEPPKPAPANPSPAAPAVENSPQGGWSFNPAKSQGGTGAAPSAGSTGPAKPASSSIVTSPMFGLGKKAAPGSVNLNLSQNGVTSVVGADQLRKLREADGERIKSAHRGSWTQSDFSKWRSAIENYVSSVKPGNQTALNTAASPFATYLNGMHNRIHPIFADSFLASLDALPKDHPLNNNKMFARLEIVLTKEGRLQKMGIVKTSGVTAFDIAALDSVSRAAPFGPAPTAIISTDGNVYLHWEFHRDEVYACSTQGASPFLLNLPPKGPDPQPPGPAPTNTPKERGLPPANTRETREGMWTPPVTTLPRATNG
jgi:TonB family protein